MTTKEIIILVNTGNSSGRDLLRGVLRFATVSRHWDLRICDLADNGAERFLALISNGHTDGVISSELEDPTIAAALEHSIIPLSVIGTRENALPTRHTNFVTTTSDEVAVGTLGAQTLLGYGLFNSFAFVNMRRSSYRYLSSLRERGFIQQIKRAGIRPIIYNTDKPESESDIDDLRAWTLSLPKPTAVLTASDARAVDLLRATTSARLRVPHDVTILGIDDDEFKCLSTSPTLSSIHLDFENQGYEAARQLDSMVRSRRQNDKRTCHFAGTIRTVERSSTRTLAPGRTLVERAKEFIAQNADHALTVKDVVAFSRVSQRLLFLRFKEFSDKSIREIINIERIRFFCKRLRTGNGTIQEIAGRCGFRNMKTLRSLFTAATGQTIRDWRKSAEGTK